MFSADWFFDLDKRLRQMGLDSDAQSFDEIREILSQRKILSSDAFAENCVYVILAGGFSQKTAKKIHAQIMNFLYAKGADFNGLFALFHNKNKINAICKIWDNRAQFRNEYYSLNDTNARINYLMHLPHIGKITANHLARNLGEDVVKYDIWIQRLGVVYAQNPALSAEIDNKKLSKNIKSVCDDMFNQLVAITGLPRGYIDVVLWKACQNKLIVVDDGLEKRTLS